MAVLVALLSSACVAQAQGEPAPDLTAHADAAGSQASLDLTQPAPDQPATDAEIFDESVLFAPNFGLGQNDPTLSDLFGPSGGSNLCFPTALAQNSIYLYAYATPRLGALRLSGLSSDGHTIDANALIRQLAAACHTDPANGTSPANAIGCVATLITSSGYSLGDTQLISPFNQDTTLPIASREVTIRDIRTALATRTPLLIEVAWFKFDPAGKTWIRKSGHYVTAFGYDYNQAWGEDQIQLKVVNPETHYSNSRQNAIFDTVTVLRASHQPGVTYPEHRPFVLAGAGFGGAIYRGFLGMVLRVAPQAKR
jgi:hypothetical protein